MYLAFVKRKSVEEMTQRKIAMIAALYSNTNYDSTDGNTARAEFVEAIEESCNATLVKIYGADKASMVKTIEATDPFFSAMNVPQAVKDEAFS